MSILIVILVVIVISIILIFASSSYNKMQFYEIRINEAEANIDSILRKRFDLLNKSIDIIKGETKENDVLSMIVKLRSKKLSNFELDRKLYDGINEFNRYKESYPSLRRNPDFMHINISLDESEAEINAFRKYYNDLITDYNKIVKSFPSNVIAVLFKFKSREYYDGKNMEDDDKKDFKL